MAGKTPGFMYWFSFSRPEQSSVSWLQEKASGRFFLWCGMGMASVEGNGGSCSTKTVPMQLVKVAKRVKAKLNQLQIETRKTAAEVDSFS